MEQALARQQLDEIELAIAEQRYQRGMWQAFVRASSQLAEPDKRALAARISEVSRKLHRRNGFPEVTFGIGLGLELTVFAAGLVLIQLPWLLPMLAGVVALALTLQPLIKIVTGLLLGVRYDYAYLWYFEPRFKMQFGSYLQLSGGRRVGLHLAGSIGTPMALFAGYVVLAPVHPLLAYLCAAGFAGAALMQVGAFVAEWMGVRQVAGFRLSNLTSPATAAFELKQKLGRSDRPG